MNFEYIVSGMYCDGRVWFAAPGDSGGKPENCKRPGPPSDPGVAPAPPVRSSVTTDAVLDRAIAQAPAMERASGVVAPKSLRANVLAQLRADQAKASEGAQPKADDTAAITATAQGTRYSPAAATQPDTTPGGGLLPVAAKVVDATGAAGASGGGGTARRRPRWLPIAIAASAVGIVAVTALQFSPQVGESAKREAEAPAAASPAAPAKADKKEKRALGVAKLNEEKRQQESVPGDEGPRAARADAVSRPAPAKDLQEPARTGEAAAGQAVMHRSGLMQAKDDGTLHREQAPDAFYDSAVPRKQKADATPGTERQAQSVDFFAATTKTEAEPQESNAQRNALAPARDPGTSNEARLFFSTTESKAAVAQESAPMASDKRPYETNFAIGTERSHAEAEEIKLYATQAPAAISNGDLWRLKDGDRPATTTLGLNGASAASLHRNEASGGARSPIVRSPGRVVVTVPGLKPVDPGATSKAGAPPASAPAMVGNEVVAATRDADRSTSATLYWGYGIRATTGSGAYIGLPAGGAVAPAAPQAPTPQPTPTGTRPKP